MAAPLPDKTVTTVLMIRHADVHNPGDVFYGRLPRFGLSVVGTHQVSELADALEGLSVDAIYASPRLRAIQTARVLGHRMSCAQIRRSSLIDEVLTTYQGRPNSSLGKLNFYDSPAADDDETIPMVARRMSRFLDVVRRRHRGGTVIAVSHADPIMILRADRLGLPLVIKSIQGRYYPAKCSVMQFSFGLEADRPIVVYRELIRDTTLKQQSTVNSATGRAGND